MDWYLHRQAIKRLGPLLVVAPIPWLLAAYFYLDPFVALGIMTAPKASWGDFRHSAYAGSALMSGICLSGPVLGSYIGLYRRLRRGERFGPVPWWVYALLFGGVVFGFIATTAAVRYLQSA